ncbi:hypothetical protein EV356DRAFT_292471 [Viridothelium virens]|uniref:Uncharacterized protein n=1 Tax=Viridothelium virens TaxID=1048519 RepID=A0A6A6H0F5_VIRVR|nr:hypothetical protein EV356DRAFT_292471 [Viridothelium virens]
MPVRFKESTQSQDTSPLYSKLSPELRLMAFRWALKEPNGLHYVPSHESPNGKPSLNGDIASPLIFACRRTCQEILSHGLPFRNNMINVRPLSKHSDLCNLRRFLSGPISLLQGLSCEVFVWENISAPGSNDHCLLPPSLQIFFTGPQSCCQLFTLRWLLDACDELVGPKIKIHMKGVRHNT